MLRLRVSTIVLSALAVLLVTGPAPARMKKIHSIPGPDPCTQPEDRQAFEVIALKSELTVTALACHEQDRYNSFMRTYQPAVVTADRELNSYFKRAYGGHAIAEHDEYITNLASAQEQDGLKSGTAYCAAFTDMFDEVMSLQDASELADYANSQAIVQPVTFTKCSAVAVKPAAVRHHYTKRKSA